MSSLHKALEAFADAEQNPDLLRLERLLSRFNLFEAVGVVRHELRHSDFLAYLLNPSQHHGLGAVFLKGLLQAVLLTTEGASAVSPSELDVWDLSQAVVQREWHHIDILVIDDINRFAVLIENKVDTGEHSGQLKRYYSDVCSHYPGYNVVALFLTPDGDAPSSNAYHAVSYTLVCQVIEKIAQDSRATRDGEIVMVLKHYAQMLRRHIVSDSDVAELCRSIYQKHRQALDSIFEHRPDQQAQIGQYVKRLIQETPTLDLGAVAKGWVVFVPTEWHGPRLVTPHPPHLYFEFHNRANYLNILCTLGPDDDTEKRIDIFDMARRYHFTGCAAKLNRGPCHLAVIPILHADDYEKTQEEIEALISNKWTLFLRDELPRIVKAVREEEWLWETP